MDEVKDRVGSSALPNQSSDVSPPSGPLAVAVSFSLFIAPNPWHISLLNRFHPGPAEIPSRFNLFYKMENLVDRLKQHGVVTGGAGKTKRMSIFQ
jgi:hypothetical protein